MGICLLGSLIQGATFLKPLTSPHPFPKPLEHQPFPQTWPKPPVHTKLGPPDLLETIANYPSPRPMLGISCLLLSDEAVESNPLPHYKRGNCPYRTGHGEDKGLAQALAARVQTGCSRALLLGASGTDAMPPTPCGSRGPTCSSRLWRCLKASRGSSSKA